MDPGCGSGSRIKSLLSQLPLTSARDHCTCQCVNKYLPICVAVSSGPVLREKLLTHVFSAQNWGAG